MNFKKEQDKQEEVHVKAELAGWWLVLWDDKVVEVLVLGHSDPRGGCQHFHISLLCSARNKPEHHTDHGSS